MIGFPWMVTFWCHATFAIPIKSHFLHVPPTFIETSRFWWKPRFWYHGRNHEKHEKWSNRALLYIYIYRIGGKREKHRFRHHDPHHWNRVPGQKLRILCGMSRRNAILEWLVRWWFWTWLQKVGYHHFGNDHDGMVGDKCGGVRHFFHGRIGFSFFFLNLLQLRSVFLMCLTAQIRPFTCTRHSGRHFL